MTEFKTKRLPDMPDAVAPDGSDVRILLGLAAGGMAHFELPPGRHQRPSLIERSRKSGFFLSGRGEMWRKQEEREEVVPVEPGVCLTIPLGTHFQFRSLGDAPLTAVGVTMPPVARRGRSCVGPGELGTDRTVSPGTGHSETVSE